MCKYNNDRGLEYLLSLNGQRFDQDECGRFYVAFYASLKEQINNHVPHEVKYSLTLHDSDLSPRETRIFGIDNAHGGKFDTPKHARRPQIWDHVHTYDGKIKQYHFKDSSTLMEDFWCTVDKILNSYDIKIS